MPISNFSPTIPLISTSVTGTRTWKHHLTSRVVVCASESLLLFLSFSKPLWQGLSCRKVVDLPQQCSQYFYEGAGFLSFVTASPLCHCIQWPRFFAGPYSGSPLLNRQVKTQVKLGTEPALCTMSNAKGRPSTSSWLAKVWSLAGLVCLFWDP